MVETHGTDGRRMAGNVTRIGERMVIEGKVTGGEDLVIDGEVAGTIELRQHVVTVGRPGRVQAEVSARSVVVLGRVQGDIRAGEKVSIGESGRVDGVVSAPRVAVADGAHVQAAAWRRRRAGPIGHERLDAERGSCRRWR